MGLKRRSNSTGCLPSNSTAKNDDASAIEIAEAEHELKKHIERMASLLRKSKADSAVDVESQLAAQLSQMLGKIGKGEDSKDTCSDNHMVNPKERSDLMQQEGRERQYPAQASTVPAPPRADSWEFPMSCEEKKARIIMLTAM